MTAKPLAISDLYDLVGYLDESIRGVTDSQARIVLVGGSAFMYHFPNAHASYDADMCLVAPVSGAKIQLTQTVEALGFYPQGKCWKKDDLWYTLEVFQTSPEIGSLQMIDELVLGESSTGRSFPLLSASAMIFDRLVATVYWNDMQSAIKVNMAIQNGMQKVDLSKLAKWIRSEGIVSNFATYPISGTSWPI
jgi:hypothetical protein